METGHGLAPDAKFKKGEKSKVPAFLNTVNSKMKWEQSKMPLPMCLTVLLTMPVLSAAHYSPYSGVKRSGEAASNTTSHTAFLRGISFTMARLCNLRPAGMCVFVRVCVHC